MFNDMINVFCLLLQLSVTVNYQREKNVFVLLKVSMSVFTFSTVNIHRHLLVSIFVNIRTLLHKCAER